MLSLQPYKFLKDACLCCAMFISIHFLTTMFVLHNHTLDDLSRKSGHWFMFCTLS